MFYPCATIQFTTVAFDGAVYYTEYLSTDILLKNLPTIVFD